jgi:chemotaxis protein MotB
VPEAAERHVDRASPAWLITYADMATLLLVFFIFLFSMAELPEARFQAAMGALRAHFGLRPRHGSTVEARRPVEVRRRRRREETRFGAPGEEPEVTSGGIVVRAEGVIVGGRIEFERGETSLDEGDKAALRRLADRLRGYPNVIEIRGHAEPGEGRKAGWADDFNLSLARTMTVLRFLSDEEDAGLRRSRLRAVGAGSEEPSLLFPEDPARARRVEVEVLREPAMRLEEGPVSGGRRGPDEGSPPRAGEAKEGDGHA